MEVFNHWDFSLAKINTQGRDFWMGEARAKEKSDCRTHCFGGRGYRMGITIRMGLWWNWIVRRQQGHWASRAGVSQIWRGYWGATQWQGIPKSILQTRGFCQVQWNSYYISFTGICPGEMENHSPATQVCCGKKGLGAPLEEMLMIQHPQTMSEVE